MRNGKSLSRRDRMWWIWPRSGREIVPFLGKYCGTVMYGGVGGVIRVRELPFSGSRNSMTASRGKLAHFGIRNDESRKLETLVATWLPGHTRLLLLFGNVHSRDLVLVCNGACSGIDISDNYIRPEIQHFLSITHAQSVGSINSDSINSTDKECLPANDEFAGQSRDSTFL